MTLILVISAPACAANLVVNGGFETGDFTGWTLSGNLNAEYVNDQPVPPHSGRYAAQLGEVNSPGFMTQEIPTVLGDTYTLSFWLAGTGAAGPPNLFIASWGGTTLLDMVNYQAPTTYTEYVFAGLLPTGSSTQLNFGYQQNVSYVGLDDISVVASGSFVPEPSTLSLLTMGGLGAFAALGITKRRHPRRGEVRRE